jgi:small-conductance mechanosensitive channel
MIPAAGVGGFDLNSEPFRSIAYIAVGVVVLVIFVVASRPIAHVASQQLGKRQVRGDMVVLVRRVVTAAVIVIGVFTALGFAVESANVTLFGLLLATIVAALGVQDLLKDYVSGYYVLLERHIHVGDRITIGGDTGTVTDVRLRVTLLRTEAGDLVIVPNSELFTNAVKVRTSSGAASTPAPPE